MTHSTDALPLFRSRFKKTTDVPRVVLIVDDHMPIRTFLSAFLEAEGYQIRTAGSVPQAVALLATEKLSAVILDVRMPGGSGLDLLETIRRDSSLANLPVLILTGADLTAEEEAVIAGHRAYVFYKSEQYEAPLAVYLEQLT